LSLLLVLMAAGAARAGQTPKPAAPVDPVEGILDAFKTHQVVMLPAARTAPGRTSICFFVSCAIPERRVIVDRDRTQSRSVPPQNSIFPRNSIRRDVVLASMPARPNPVADRAVVVCANTG